MPVHTGGANTSRPETAEVASPRNAGTLPELFSSPPVVQSCTHQRDVPFERGSDHKSLTERNDRPPTHGGVVDTLRLEEIDGVTPQNVGALPGSFSPTHDVHLRTCTSEGPRQEPEHKLLPSQEQMPPPPPPPPPPTTGRDPSPAAQAAGGIPPPPVPSMPPPVMQKTASESPREMIHAQGAGDVTTPTPGLLRPRSNPYPRRSGPPPPTVKNVASPATMQGLTPKPEPTRMSEGTSSTSKPVFEKSSVVSTSHEMASPSASESSLSMVASSLSSLHQDSDSAVPSDVPMPEVTATPIQASTGERDSQSPAPADQIGEHQTEDVHVDTSEMTAAPP